MNNFIKNLILPPIIPYQLSAKFENGWTDQYGAISIALLYAKMKSKEPVFIKGFWDHGCGAPWINNSPNWLVCNAINLKNEYVYTCRKDNEIILQKAGYLKSQAIGLPILYTKSLNLRRIPRSLLVMPTHTLSGDSFDDKTAFQEYVKEIKLSTDGFEHVVICIHPSCHKNGLWTREFESQGFDVIYGALNYDRNALIRMRALFEQFEVVTTNGWGSHVAYALAFGA